MPQDNSNQPSDPLEAIEAKGKSQYWKDLNYAENKKLEIDFAHARLTWSYVFATNEGDWSFNMATQDDLTEIIEVMKIVEIDPPQSVKFFATRRSHLIDCNALPDRTLDRIREHGESIGEEIEEIYSLWITEVKRLICLRPSPVASEEESTYIMRILWWDPRHEVCRSKFKPDP